MDGTPGAFFYYVPIPQGFLNADSGELTVVEVDAVPHLTPSATIFAQVKSIPSPKFMKLKSHLA